ncbi:hypothetical protein OB905_12350 [Halobacteria archaeon AArc-dxtr1]|nr:hypothetical protein [Halobacteria archaeon AArc-dxtr1]
MPERATSEVLGYALLFGLITLSASALFLVGATSLDEVREDSAIQNGQQTLEELAMTIDDHIAQGVQRRSTPVGIGEGAIGFDRTAHIEVTVVQHEPDAELHAETFATGDSYTGTIDPVTYIPPGATPPTESGGTNAESAVVYANGAVSREGGAGNEWLREPRLRVSTEFSMIPLIETTGTNTTWMDATTVSEITTKRASSRQLRWDGEETYAVEIRIQTRSDRADLWANYIESSESNATCQQQTTNRDTLRCVAVTGAVYVPTVRLDVSVEGEP